MVKDNRVASNRFAQEGKGLGCQSPSPAKQERLEKLFEHATNKTTTSDNFDYATDLLNECVRGDPGSVRYAKAYIENLRKKYKNNRKGIPLAQFRERGARSAMRQALDQHHWDEVVQNGLKVLTINPWDVPTLTALATVAKKCGYRECEMYYLHCAWSASPKAPDTNRRCAIALAERGLVDQAIACWHRVEEALPGDDEATRFISELAVQKNYSGSELADDEEVSEKLRAKAQCQEETILQSIEQEPENLTHYLELSQICINDERYKDAKELLAKAYKLSGNADIREKWEDAQLRHLRQRIVLAEDPEAKKKLQTEYFEKDLEVCKNRVERYPSNLAFRYELGYRYMLTKRYVEAIGELQAAKTDPRRRGVCMLVLGQCFQQIKQYRLAMSHYESAIEKIPDRDADNKKRALYFAGRLAMGLNDVDTAEKHLSALAGVDFAYKDVPSLLDKIATLRAIAQSAKDASEVNRPHDAQEPPANPAETERVPCQIQRPL